LRFQNQIKKTEIKVNPKSHHEFIRLLFTIFIIVKRLLYLMFAVMTAYPMYGQSMEQYLDSVIFYKQIYPSKALDFGLDAISKSQNEEPSLLYLKINTRVGQILSEQLIDGQALKFYNKSLKIFSALPSAEREEKNVQLPPWVLINIGNIYFQNNDFEAAEKNYLMALENFLLFENLEMKNYGLATTYDNLAKVFLKDKNFDKSKDYFEKALEIRNTSQKIEDILYSKLSFLSLYIEENNFQEVERAFKEIQLFYNRQTKIDFVNKVIPPDLTRNYGYALIRYGRYNMAIKKYDTALVYFQDALEKLSDFVLELPTIYTYIAEVYYLKNDLSAAETIVNSNLRQISKDKFNRLKQKNLKLLESIYVKSENQDALIRVKDLLISYYINKEKDVLNKEFSKLESYLLLSSKQQEINEARITYNTYLFLMILLLVVLIFSFISLRLNLILQKSNTKKAQTEKKLIEMELKNKKLALINKTKFIFQQNQNLSYILESTRDNNTPKHNIEAKIESLLVNFKTNERFEKQFEDVYPGFFNKLVKSSKRLTQGDLRLCAFLRLNQTTKEIAQMTGVSIRTIESQKYRLKKKLNMSDKDSLITFIFSVDSD
jgi:tetratricopeptide (TPR) repeat protein/DNA-binding CsgD family transcriptional regulator